jgi:type I restriction enzyme S subunit
MEAVNAESGAIVAMETRRYADVMKGYTFFEEGDVLFAKITPCMQNGKHAIARGLIGGIGFGSTEFHVIRCGDVVQAEWVHAFLRQPAVLLDATRHFTGAVGQQRVPPAYLRDLTIPCPAVPEQQRIASVLDDAMAQVNAARAAAEERLAALEVVPAALLRGVFPVSGARLLDGWNWVRLGTLLREAQSGFPCGARDPEGIVQVRMNNVDTRGNLDLQEVLRVPREATDLERYALAPGDVLFNNTNSTELVGKSALFQGHHEPVVYSNHFTRLRTCPGELLPELLASWLNLQWEAGVFAAICNRWIGQSAVKPAMLLDLSFPKPPLSEQLRIVRVLGAAMAEAEVARAAAQAELDAIAALPAALLRRAFSGGL